MGLQPHSLPPFSHHLHPSPGARRQGSNFEILGSHHAQNHVMAARPNSLARTQRQVQSSTADLLGKVPPALISISCSFGAGPRASLGQPPILTRLTSDPCPLAKPLEVYGADSVLARLWGEPSPNFGRHHEFRSLFLGPRSCFGRRQGLANSATGLY
ncbi:hypothetical protein J3E68DRAFT_408994 [Trichoderma sp. SZMC 28012]